MHPGLINEITSKFGYDYLANCGGSIHGHPAGTKSGAKAMRQAIDHCNGNELTEAINKWGFVGSVPQWYQG
jgi:ribulose 1,5-bisphosphate carboxylase large subunit-like protein